MRNVIQRPAPQDERPEDRWLTVDELGEMLGLKRSRIYYMTHSGLIPHYKIGQTLRFRLDEIHAWLESKRVRTQERRMSIWKSAEKSMA